MASDSYLRSHYKGEGLTTTEPMALLSLLHVAASDGSGDKTLLSTTAGIFYAWSPDGDEVAVAESTYLTSTVRFVGLDGAVRTSVTHDGSSGGLSWSPDGKYVVSRFTISGGDAIVAVPSDGSSAKEVVTATPSATHPGSLFASGWLPSGGSWWSRTSAAARRPT